MNRPHVIIHTVASVDGRVSLGANRTRFEDIRDERWQSIWASDTSLDESVRDLVSRHNPQVLLVSGWRLSCHQLTGVLHHTQGSSFFTRRW